MCCLFWISKQYIEGWHTKARKIITSRPELLIDSSATVKDISGKEIEGLTPLQAAICAWDVDMVQMMEEVFYQKILSRVTLSVEPKIVIQGQFEAIYPNGDIDLVETAQKVQAQEFKTYKLNEIFAAINAATDEQVQAEKTNPGQHTDSQLNAALHNFRQQFAATSNGERIFNPFYLLKAFELYDEQFDNFTGNDQSKWNRRNLFWCQIIGYIQRHLPACYLQAFAQGIYYIVENNEKLQRNFKFKYGEGYIWEKARGLNDLGHNCRARGRRGRPAGGGRRGRVAFKIYCEQKNQVWRT
jgi:hypothetical protein